LLWVIRGTCLVRIVERWYFGLCWNLRLVIKVITSWRILVSFGGFFEKCIFCMVKYLSFHNSFLCKSQGHCVKQSLFFRVSSFCFRTLR
jgi:hypothetical protein